MRMRCLFSILFIVLLVACGDGFLDVDNKTQKETNHFLKTSDEAEQLLTAAYHQLIVQMPGQSLFVAAELMSDDRLGGGGSSDRFVRAIASYKKTNEDMFTDAWAASFQGIYRCNFLLAHLDKVASWESVEQRTNIEGQAYFLRAYFYFDLVRLFGTVPLITSPEPVNKPKAVVEELYGRIASDLKLAIEKLPAVPYQKSNKKQLGRATRWAAQGYLAKVFLFYTGYYGKESLPLAEGSFVTKEKVINWLDDCIMNSGHELIDDFRNLWPYSYSKDYKYTKENKLSWIGEEGDNLETVFAQKYTGRYWDDTNPINVYWGLRFQPDYRNCFPFGQGWGMGTVNPVIYREWPDNDLRKKGSVLNVQDPAEGINKYVVNSGRQMEDTYLYQKKYIPINVWKADGSVQSYGSELYGLTYDFQSENVQDVVILRFADILLMGAELGGTHAQEYLDRVRGRVHLESVPVTLENIKNERRWELAFEGIRYYDLLRWHDEELLTMNRKEIHVLNMGLSCIVSIPFRKETGGFVQIPQTQIRLSGGVLTQNPGWEGAGNMY